MSRENDLLTERLQAGSKSYSCGGFLQSADELLRQMIFTELYFDRLRRKHDYILHTLHRYNNNWDQTIYHMLLRSMDVGQNRNNYITLADTVPLNVIRRDCITQRAIENVLLGMAGLLDIFKEDEYIKAAKRQAAFTMHKFTLAPMNYKMWALNRINPRKHPILRLSQVSKLIALDRLNMNAICRCKTIADIEQTFRIEANNYWSDTLMAQTSYFAPLQYIGYDKSHLLGINFIIPLQLAYADYTANDNLRDQALNLLESINAERNRYTIAWASYGVRVKNALESQALIQLATEFCHKQRCDECPVGKSIRQKINAQK